MTCTILTRPLRIPAALVLVGYLAAGVLLATAHRDDLNGPACAGTAFAAHTCGAHEHHVPLELWHPCPACLLGSHCACTAAFPSPMLYRALLVAVAVPAPAVPHVSSPETLNPSKRGPPTA